jgi:putative chitinase
MLKNPPGFFARVRSRDLLGTLDQGEVNGCNAILKACAGFPGAWAAYCLATAYHETAGTMQPIHEVGGPVYLRRMYDIEGARPQMARDNGNTTPGDGVKYAGRGYVQLTWKDNYERAGAALDLPLVALPDLALEPAVAADIMRSGMRDGWFTGRKLAHYLPRAPRADRTDYRAARRIINGTDKADAIALHADAFEDALVAGGWA